MVVWKSSCAWGKKKLLELSTHAVMEGANCQVVGVLELAFGGLAEDVLKVGACWKQHMGMNEQPHDGETRLVYLTAT